MSNVNALTCPNCGASVNVPAEGQEIVKCPYCNTTLQLPHPHEPAADAASSAEAEVRAELQEALATARHTARPASTASKPSAAGRIFGVLITLVIIGGIAVGIFAAVAPAVIKTLWLYDGVVPVVNADKAAPDLAAVVHWEDEDNIRLAVLDGTTHQSLWVSDESWSTNGSHLPPLPGGDLLFFMSGNKLMAYHISNGKLAWQQNLATGIDTSCKGCLQFVDGKPVLLSKDGTLQGLDPANGQQAWSVALNSNPRELLLANGKPAVVEMDANKDNSLQIYDAATGKLSQQYGAGCKGTGPGMKENQGLEEVYLSPDGKLAYLMYYSRGPDQPACAQQVDLAAGKVNWTSTPGDNQVWPSAWFAAEVMVSKEGVFFYEDNTLSLIDASTGALTQLFKEPKYRQVTPVASQPGRVFAVAIPDYDSETKELWGIDTASGKKVWTYKMQAKSIIDPYRVVLTSAGVTVVQCLEDEKVSQWETLDPMTGASQGLKQISTDNYNFLEDAWTPTTAYLKIDNTLYTVDVKTGTVLSTWP